jgi:hypothetical protein
MTGKDPGHRDREIHVDVYFLGVILHLWTTNLTASFKSLEESTTHHENVMRNMKKKTKIIRILDRRWVNDTGDMGVMDDTQNQMKRR